MRIDVTLVEEILETLNVDLENRPMQASKYVLELEFNLLLCHQYTFKKSLFTVCRQLSEIYESQRNWLRAVNVLVHIPIKAREK